MIPKAREVRLKPKVRKVLEARCRAPTTPQRDVKRARIVLLAAEGRSTRSIAEEVGVQPRIVSNWRRRFAEHGLDGLKERPRAGKKPADAADQADLRWRGSGQADRVSVLRAAARSRAILEGDKVSEMRVYRGDETQAPCCTGFKASRGKANDARAEERGTIKSVKSTARIAAPSLRACGRAYRYRHFRFVMPAGVAGPWPTKLTGRAGSPPSPQQR